MREEKASAPAASASAWSPPRQPALSPWCVSARHTHATLRICPRITHPLSRRNSSSVSNIHRSSAAQLSPANSSTAPRIDFAPASASDLGSVLVCIPAAKKHLGGSDDRRPSALLASPILAAEESAFSPSRINLGAAALFPNPNLNRSSNVAQPRGFSSKLIPYRFGACG